MFKDGYAQGEVKSVDPFDLDHAVSGMPHLTLIYNELSSGRSDKDIKREQGLSIGYIAKAKRRLIQHHPDLYEKIAGKPATPYRFLLDENMFFRDPAGLNAHVVSLWNHFGRVTHTNHEKISGSNDNDIWSWARQSRVNAIITQDVRMQKTGKDLTLIALRSAYDRIQRCFDRDEVYDTRNLPVLVQLTPSQHNPKKTMDSLVQHSAAVSAFLNDPPSLIFRLTPDGAMPILSYKDIAMNDWKTVKDMALTQHKHSSPAPV